MTDTLIHAQHVSMAILAFSTTVHQYNLTEHGWRLLALFNTSHQFNFQLKWAAATEVPMSKTFSFIQWSCLVAQSRKLWFYTVATRWVCIKKCSANDSGQRHVEKKCKALINLTTSFAQHGIWSKWSKPHLHAQQHQRFLRRSPGMKPLICYPYYTLSKLFIFN